MDESVLPPWAPKEPATEAALLLPVHHHLLDFVWNGRRGARKARASARTDRRKRDGPRQRIRASPASTLTIISLTLSTGTARKS